MTEDPPKQPEQGATGRRWAISLTLAIAGAVVLVVGLIAQYLPAIFVGVVLLVVFGLTAAGMKRGEVSAGGGLLKAKADFRASAPPEPDNDEDSQSA